MEEIDNKAEKRKDADINEKSIKAVFSDIDGTIAKDNLPITYKDQEAVKKLRTQGHLFFILYRKKYSRNETCHTIF